MIISRIQIKINGKSRRAPRARPGRVQAQGSLVISLPHQHVSPSQHADPWSATGLASEIPDPKICWSIITQVWWVTSSLATNLNSTFNLPQLSTFLSCLEIGMITWNWKLQASIMGLVFLAQLGSLETTLRLSMCHLVIWTWVLSQKPKIKNILLLLEKLQAYSQETQDKQFLYSPQ